MIARQRGKRCLTCGSSTHPTEKCRKGHYSRHSPDSRKPRPRTSPGRSSRTSHSRQKVNFKVSALEEGESTHDEEVINHRHDRTPALGREGDVEDDAERVVDEYIRTHDRNFFPTRGQQNIADYEYSSQSDE